MFLIFAIYVLNASPSPVERGLQGGPAPPRARRGREMAPWEDRSAPHPTTVASQPQNHAEIIGRIQGAEVNDPPGAPESGSGGAADRSRRAARTGPGDRLRPYRGAQPLSTAPAGRRSPPSDLLGRSPSAKRGGRFRGVRRG